MLDTPSRVIKRKGRTLLTDKSTRPKRGSVQLDKIPEKSFKMTIPVDETPDETALKLKAMNLTEDELIFLKEYRKLEDLERQKGIKFFECVGDPPIRTQYITKVEVKRQNFIEKGQDEMRDDDCHRFQTAVNRDKVIVPTNLKLAAKPRWDVYENNHFAMRKRLVSLFLKVANKMITRIRAGKRLRLIKNRLKSQGIKTKADAKKWVEEDGKMAKNAQIGNGGDEDDIVNVRFKFSFDNKMVKSDLTMPIEYETNVASFIEKIECQPIINFDDLEAFDPIEALEFEIEQYKPM